MPGGKKCHCQGFQVHDAQETSNFEQTADGIIGMQMPVKYMTEGTVLAKVPSYGDIVVTPRLIVTQVLKQKKGATGKTFLYDALYETNDVGPYSGGADQSRLPYRDESEAGA